MRPPSSFKQSMPPGPSPVLLGLDSLAAIRRDQLGFFSRLHQHHGDVVQLRLGPYRNWVLYHPGHVWAILSTHARDFVRFEPLMGVLAQWNGASLMIAEGEAWRRQRRVILPGFRTANLAAYAASVVDLADAMRVSWSSAAIVGTPVDVDTAFSRLALRIAAKTMFSCDEIGDEARIGQIVEILTEVAFEETMRIVPVPGWIPTSLNRKKQEAIAALDRFIMTLVAGHRARTGPDADDPLSLVLRKFPKGSPLVRDEAVTLLLAGHETTGAALSWIAHLLSARPVLTAGLQQAIDTTLRGRLPTYADLPDLACVDRVVKEALRLYPPAYTALPRRATAAVHLEGVTIARGDIVQMPTYCIHRDARWFPDPERFDPERFAGEPSWPQGAYMPFGVGPRMCVAMSFATMELVLVVTTLLRSMTPTATSNRVIPLPRSSLRPKGGLKLRWHLRGEHSPLNA